MILPAVLLLLLLLLGATPVHFAAKFDRTLQMTLRIGWLPVPLPRKKKKRPRKLPKSAIGPLLRLLPGAAGLLRRGLVIEELELLVITGGEAAEAALRCGKCRAAAGIILPVLTQTFCVRRCTVSILPGCSAAVTGRLRLQIRLWRLAWLGCRYGLRALNILKQAERSEPHERTPDRISENQLWHGARRGRCGFHHRQAHSGG